jgi:exodeoxyribonuclease V beta subunit
VSTFDVTTVPLQGFNLIEASAGTGKTYTLAELYLRLILENSLSVSEILVVTYTRAATEELRDRLRNKLVVARNERLNSNDQLQRQQLTRLNLAIQSFDQAAIYTIHGFCQRVLTDFAFESGTQFDMELVGDDTELLASLAADFWRREVIANPDKGLAQALVKMRQTPMTLLKSVRSLIGKPYLTLDPLPELQLDVIESRLQSQFSRLQSLWAQEGDKVIATLQNTALLSQQSYKKNNVERWLLLMKEMLESKHSTQSLFDGFDKFTPALLEKALKKNQHLPSLFFWSACETYLELIHELKAARDLQLQSLRVKLLMTIREQLPATKQQLLQQSYDDLLLNLQAALSGDNAEALIASLRGQYPAALIDEFQDTDPIQYDCFHRLYHNSGLSVFFVGDPKQAIYSFRGADIFTYLAAKQCADNQYTLSTNWRSHISLVDSLNTLFSRQAVPFNYEQIPYVEVGAARDKLPAIQQTPAQSPLRVMWLESDKVLDKNKMMLRAAEATADDIALLLNQAAAGEVTYQEESKTRPLNGGDIAILVRNHRQATQMQQSLAQRGIHSVQQGRDNVFASAQAEVLQRLLYAVAEPFNTGLVTAALASPLFAMSASQLQALQQDELKWLEQADVFEDLRQQWLQHGFMSMWRKLLLLAGVEQRLLARSDGERQLTNFQHLAELIQSFATTQNGSIEAVQHWLQQHRLSAEKEDETAQLRLESDEHLVKIQTIHTSKGLEYPMVYCPFLWAANIRAAKDPVISYHDTDTHQARAAFAEPALSAAAPLVRAEEFAEDLRLLYVALTRARERCVISWGAVKEVEHSALFHFLHPQLEQIDAEAMREQLSQLADSIPGLSVEQISKQLGVSYQGSEQNTHAFAARNFSGELQAPWRIGSFTWLSRGHSSEKPDYDAVSEASSSVELDNSRNRFSFPRGAQAGTCLHSIFEKWDFQSDDAALEKLTSQCLQSYGFDTQWTDCVVAWVKAVLATPLNQQGLCLADIGLPQRLTEMAFYYPAPALTADALKSALANTVDDFPLLQRLRDSLSFYDLNGFIKGFIDLVFEHQGKFYVLDYKSNWLGTQQADYDRTGLDEAMLSHAYPLQYLLYSLALHRYLKLRLPDYDPARHFGGVYYLFLRGMQPEWGQSGVYFDPLSPEILKALDEAMQGGEHG